MSKSKIILIFFIICFITIICSIFYIISKTGSTKEQQAKTLKINVDEVIDIKTTFNVGNCINSMIEDFYDIGQYRNYDTQLLPYSLIKKLNLEEGLKSYFIEKAYSVKLDDDIIVYFTKGYIVNEFAEDIKKEDILLTFINDTEYNTGRLYLYGEGYTDIFKYQEDISKTEVMKTTGLKIRMNDANQRQLDEIIMDNEFFKNRKIDNKIEEVDLVFWYLRDYRIRQANGTEKNVENDLNFSSYTGNYDEGYNVIDNSTNREYFIKPGNIPMEYDIIIK